jgi:probable F420-dependent oxidoreductase
MASPGAVHIAQLAESLGYESLWTGEHMALPHPEGIAGRRPPNHPFFDPIVGMTHLAAHTQTIKLGLGVLILPQRHPVQLAKELATLDILSNGRLIVGVGIGYLEPEFRAVGVDFRTRLARSIEYTEALQTMWGDDPPRYEGRFVTVSGVDAYPRPQTPGGPPLTLGGHVEPALRRAVKYGSGWIGFDDGRDVDEIAGLIQRLRGIAEEAGKDFEGFEVTVGTRLPLDRDGVARFAEIGVHRLVVNAEGETLAEVREIVERAAPANILPV